MMCVFELTTNENIIHDTFLISRYPVSSSRVYVFKAAIRLNAVSAVS